MNVDELIGSLQTFEVSLNGRSEKKNKGVAFVSNTQVGKDQSDKDTEEDLSDVITYIGRKFNNSLRRHDRYYRINVQDIRSDIGPQRKCLEEGKGKGVRCFKCEGFGHTKIEFHSFLKNHKKGLRITWYEFDDESEGETANKVMAFIGKYESDSSDEEMNEQELAETFILLHTKCK